MVFRLCETLAGRPIVVFDEPYGSNDPFWLSSKLRELFPNSWFCVSCYYNYDNAVEFM